MQDAVIIYSKLFRISVTTSSHREVNSNSRLENIEACLMKDSVSGITLIRAGTTILTSFANVAGNIWNAVSLKENQDSSLRMIPMKKQGTTLKKSIHFVML